MFKHIIRIFRNFFKKPEDGKKDSGRTEGLKEAGVKEKRREETPEEVAPKKKRKPAWDISQFDVPAEEGKTRFHDLGLPLTIMRGVFDLGFKYCTPIQAEILPKALAGSDATGKAQTGTGKSAAFLLNIYAQLIRKPVRGKRMKRFPRVLILAPTRELVLQIEKDARAIGKYTHLRVQSVFGGIDYEKQKRVFTDKFVDIVVATPGRLLDFKKQGVVKLDNVEILVIDEADRMLDMGFIPDVRKIVYSTPHKHKRQTMFFSATITPDVERLAQQWTRDPVHVEIEPEHVAAETVDQLVYIVTTEEKFALLWNMITRQNLERVIVFANRKDETRRLANRLRRYNINCAILSGDIPQHKRIKTLENFRAGKIRVLVATDVAARGIHIEGVSHVINYNIPQDAEDYVHRIGRTGRAGTSGISVSFACEEDSFYIPAVEEYIGNELKCDHPDEEWLELPPPPPQKPKQKKKPSGPPEKGGRPPQNRNRSNNRKYRDRRRNTNYRNRQKNNRSGADRNATDQKKQESSEQ